jgi:hypothetical protein
MERLSDFDGDGWAAQAGQLYPIRQRWFEVKWQANCLMEARPSDQFRRDRLMAEGMKGRPT